MRALVTLLLIFGFAVSAQAAPRAGIGQSFCTIGTDASAALPAATEWTNNANCSEGRFSDRHPRVWGRVNLTKFPLQSGPKTLVTDPTSFENMEIVARYADGEVKSARYGPEIATENWLPAMRFAVAIPHHDAALESLYFAVDRPEGLTIFSSAEIIPSDEIEALQLGRTIIFAFLCGIVLVPICYNMAFFGILRERFMLWHSLMLLCVASYVFSSSGLIFDVFPGASLDTRWHINIWAFALIVGLACLFSHDFIEKDKLSRATRILLRTGPIALIITTTVILYGGEPLRVIGRTLYFAAFLPWVLVFVFSIIQGLMRKSRAAWFLAASWATILFAGFERIARGVGLYTSDGSADFLMFYALAAETVLTSLGVADRFLIIRRERDLATRREDKLRSLANTDGLSGLLNRRGFDNIFQNRKKRQRYDELAIFDLDHFKEINDHYGHDVGDNVIRIVGKVLQSSKGVAARIGGDEFVLLLDDAPNEGSGSYLDLLRKKISENIAHEIPQVSERISVSAGLAPIIRGAPSGSIYALADERLYVAKERGRDKTVIDARENQQRVA